MRPVGQLFFQTAQHLIAEHLELELDFLKVTRIGDVCSGGVHPQCKGDSIDRKPIQIDQPLDIEKNLGVGLTEVALDAEKIVRLQIVVERLLYEDRGVGTFLSVIGKVLFRCSGLSLLIIPGLI